MIILNQLFSYCIDVQFQNIKEKYCQHYYETLSNVTTAKEMCRRDSLCKGVYDKSCDENYVHLCEVDQEYQDSDDGCIYDKQGNFLISSNIFIFKYISKIFQYEDNWNISFFFLEIVFVLDQRSHEVVDNEFN